MKLPSIKIGKSTHKRTAFDLSHDVHTTASVGEMQPVLFQEMIPNSTLEVKVSEFTRLAPMPAPTFGRVSTRYYHQFVPFSDLWHPFETMMTDEVYYGSDSSYRPNTVPRLSLNTLTYHVINTGAYVTLYEKVSGSTTNEFKPMINNDTTSVHPLEDKVKAIMNGYNNAAAGQFDKHINLANNVFLYNPFSATDANFIGIDGGDFVLKDPNGSNHYLVVKLNRDARRLRKILLGLGYQLNLTDMTKVSLLPIFAYFKAWYDTFAPQRTSTWKGTYAHAYLESLEQSGHYDETNVTSAECQKFRYFWDNELANCFFVDNQDWVGSHIPSVSTAPNGLPTFPYVDYNGNSTSSAQAQNSLPTVNGTVLTGLKVDIAKRLYAYANKHTVLGGKIKNLLESLYGAEYLEDDTSNFIGTSVFDVQIGDVMVSSDTEGISGAGSGAKVGEYAGRGIGYGEGNDLKFTSKTYGCWITLMTVVPKGGYFQGLDPSLLHSRKFDYYCGDFDGLGLQATPMNNVIAAQDCYQYNFTIGGNSFGYTPRYSEMKIKNNIVNGDLSLRSTRDSFDCYHLDRMISQDIVDYEEVTTNASGETVYKGLNFTDNASNLPIASEQWRTVGQYAWLGNYDRIFYNNPTLNFGNTVYSALAADDNYIIHTCFDCTYIAPMLSLSQSYETDPFDNGISVEHT